MASVIPRTLAAPHTPSPFACCLNRTHVEEVAAEGGFEVSYPHRGWRACGPTSAITAALPALCRQLPEAIASIAGSEKRFADLPRDGAGPLLIRHSIVRLNRTTALTGEPR